MAHKYAQVIKERKLARHLGTEKADQDVIDDLKIALKAGHPIHTPRAVDLGFIALDNPIEIAKAYVETREKKEAIEAKLKRYVLLLRAISQMLVTSYESVGITNLDLEDSGKVSIYPEPYLVVLKDEEFRKWCLDNNFGSSFKMNWQKANSIAKERLIAGAIDPKGTESRFRDMITWRRK